MNALSNDAQAWVFGASRELTPQESRAVLESVERFITNWTAHGAPVHAAAEIRDNRFLVIAAVADSPSGCSIDRLFGRMKDLEQALSAKLLDSSILFYRDAEGVVRSASRSEFRQLGSKGELTRDSVVFDPAVSTLGEIRGAGFEKPAAQSWHATLLG